MKKILLVLITIFIASVGFSQNVQKIEKTNKEMAEKYFDNFANQLLKNDPSITFDENQKERIKVILEKKAEEINTAIAKGLNKGDWISTNNKLDKKYEAEIIQQLSLKQRKAYKAVASK